MKTKLSTLWIAVMFNMVFADIFSIMIELVRKDTLNIPGDVTTIMAIAAVITNIPILMIYFSRTLSHKANRITNIAAAVFTMVYIVAGGDGAPHYLIIAAIEIFLLLTIIIHAWKWNDPEK